MLWRLSGITISITYPTLQPRRKDWQIQGGKDWFSMELPTGCMKVWFLAIVCLKKSHFLAIGKLAIYQLTFPHCVHQKPLSTRRLKVLFFSNLSGIFNAFFGLVTMKCSGFVRGWRIVNLSKLRKLGIVKIAKMTLLPHKYLIKVCPLSSCEKESNLFQKVKAFQIILLLDRNGALLSFMEMSIMK